MTVHDPGIQGSVPTTMYNRSLPLMSLSHLVHEVMDLASHLAGISIRQVCGF